MVRYKTFDTNPRFLAVDLVRQLLPSTFEHALNHLLDHELDLSSLDERYRNDETDAPAYPPAVVLKIILFAYSRCTIGSWPIELSRHYEIVSTRWVRHRKSWQSSPFATVSKT
jgi:hypothetical protein